MSVWTFFRDSDLVIVFVVGILLFFALIRRVIP